MKDLSPLGRAVANAVERANPSHSTVPVRDEAFNGHWALAVPMDFSLQS